MMLSDGMRDVIPLILQQLCTVQDLINIDLTCSHLRKANENGGWKRFATTEMAIPESYKSMEISWKCFLLEHVKPIYEKLVRLCNVETLRRDVEDSLNWTTFQEFNPKLYQRYQVLLKSKEYPPCPTVCRLILSQHDWPVDVGITIAIHCYLCQAPLKGRSFFTFGFEDMENENESTESFAFFDSFSLGGGDTQWWAFVVLKGTVLVPLAPENYEQNQERGEPVRIGRGGIVAFSHWNHGGCNTTSKHIYPDWDPTEFGLQERAFEGVCDEWVRVNLEEPVEASRDSPPCGWTNISSFLDEVERTMEYS